MSIRSYESRCTTGRRPIYGITLLMTLLLSLLASSVASASSIVARSVTELTNYSDVVVDGTVASVDCYWDDQGRIWTRAVVTVRSALKGAPAEELIVRQLGGELDGLHMRVEGALQLTPGERLVLFAQAHEGAYLPTLLSYSAFVVEGEDAKAPLRHASRELSFFRESATGLAAVEAEDLALPTRLDELTAQVRAAVGGAR
jgi:hypothetical protein